MAVVTRYTLSTFDLEKAKSGALCAIVKKDIAANNGTISIEDTSDICINCTITDFIPSTDYIGKGICRISGTGSLCITMGGTDYEFNMRGQGIGAASIFYKLLTLTLTTAVPREGEQVTRSIDTGGNETDPTYVTGLSARDEFASQALKGLMDRVPDPSVLSDSEINYYCSTAYKWASMMMLTAANVRSQVTTSSQEPSVNIESLDSNVEKLLNNIAVAISEGGFGGLGGDISIQNVVNNSTVTPLNIAGTHTVVLGSTGLGRDAQHPLYVDLGGSSPGNPGSGGVSLNTALAAINADNNIGVATTSGTAIIWNGSAYVWGNPTPAAHNHDSRYYISEGTIHLGSDSITPLTSYTEQYRGTVTNVSMPTVPTGFSASVANSTTTPAITLSFASGYSLPTTAKQANWDTAYGWGNHANAGYALANNVYTKTAADETFLKISFFSSLFKAYSGTTEVTPNNATTNVDNIKAMFGFWTEQYISSLGQNAGGVSGGVGNVLWTELNDNTNTNQIALSHLTGALDTLTGGIDNGNNYAVFNYENQLYVRVPWTDTKNTAGSTNTTSKIYLVGAASQGANPQTYSNINCYASGGYLYSGGSKVLTGNQTITLTGDVTGSGTTSIATTIGNGKVTNAMLAGSITNSKLANSSITVNGTTISLGGSSDTTKWGTARNISIADSDGSNTGSAVSVNGSAAVTLKLPSTIKATLNGNATTATTASKLSTGTQTLWGQTYWTDGGVPTTVGTSANPASLSYVTNIDSLLYFNSAYTMVGIGTNNPQRKFHINHTSRIMARLEVSNSNGSKYVDIGVDNDGLNISKQNCSNALWVDGNTIISNGHLSINDFVVENDNNDRLKFNGNIYATGAVSALGMSANGTDITLSALDWSQLNSADNDANHKIDNSHLNFNINDYALKSWVQANYPGTVTQVNVGASIYNPSSGVVSLPAYLPLSAGGSNTLTNSLYITYNNGVFIKDSSSGNNFAAIFHNTGNLWIGAYAGASYHHKGQTYISTGWDESHNTGNSTINVCVPSSNNVSGNNSYTTYPVWHEGNSKFLRSLSPRNTTAIVSSSTAPADLNTFTTAGTYTTTGGNGGSTVAASLSNKPAFNGGFRMYVTETNPDSNYIHQRIVTYNGRIFDRISSYNSTSQTIIWPNAWRESAYTDSTVEKAERLAVARSLWGNSFDGTADINGDITINRTGQIIGVFAENANGGYDIKYQATGLKHRIWFGIGSGNYNRGIYGYDVNSSTRATSNGQWYLCFTNDSDFSNRRTILNYGNVGIGTNNPSEKLQVDGNIYATGAVSALGISAEGSNGGALSLLVDMNISSPANGHVLTYSNGQWVNVPQSSLDYLPLSAGNGKPLTSSLHITTGYGISASDGNGLLVYKPATTWSGINSTQWGIGAGNCQGVIRSNNDDLLHYRSGTSYKIWDAYNVNPMRMLSMAANDNYDDLSQYTWDRGSFVAVNWLTGNNYNSITLTDKGLYTTLVSFGYSNRTIQLKGSGWDNTLKYRHVTTQEGTSNTYVLSPWQTFAFTSDLNNYLPLTAGTSSRISGNVYFSTSGLAIHMKDSAGTDYCAIRDNATNLWIGASQSNGYHHNGLTYISAGWNGSAGNSTIYVSVPSSNNVAGNNTYTNYGVWHAGNLTPKEKYRVQVTGADAGWHHVANVFGYSSFLVSVGGGWSNAASTLATFYVSHHHTTNRISQIGTSYLGVITKVRIRDLHVEIGSNGGSIAVDVYVNSTNTTKLCAEIIPLDSYPDITMFSFTTNDMTSGFGGTTTGEFTPIEKTIENRATADYLPLTAGENYPLTGSLYINNARYLMCKDTSGNAANAFGLTSANNLFVGYGTAQDGRNTYLYGNNVYIGIGTSNTVAATFTSGGNVGIGVTPGASTIYKLDVAGSAHFAGDSSGRGISLDNDKAITLKDTNNVLHRALFLNSANPNKLCLGYGTTKSGGYDTEICGNNIIFKTGQDSNNSNEPTQRVKIDSAGIIQIGGGYIEWDSTNQMLKFSGGNGIYSTGAVSALGIAGDLNGQVTRPMTFTEAVTLSSTLTVNGATSLKNNVTVAEGKKLMFGSSSFSLAKNANQNYISVTGETRFGGAVTLNGTVHLNFGDTDHYIYKNANGILTVNSNTAFGGNMQVNGAIETTDTITTEGNIEFSDGEQVVGYLYADNSGHLYWKRGNTSIQLA